MVLAIESNGARLTGDALRTLSEELSAASAVLVLVGRVS